MDAMPHEQPPDEAAIAALKLLPCPACGTRHPALRPDRDINGTPFCCAGCGAVVFARPPDPALKRPESTACERALSQARDGMLAWNAWALRATNVRNERIAEIDAEIDEWLNEPDDDD